MFRLNQITPTGGDCTAAYAVTTDPACTLVKFVEDVLSRREWGRISINGTLSFDYKGDIIEPLPDDILQVPVKKVRAVGGWSNMNYYISL